MIKSEYLNKEISLDELYNLSFSELAYIIYVVSSFYTRTTLENFSTFH